MAKLHHATLKAAVTRYSELHAEGKPEEEVKAAIADDEKGFDTDEVNQIYDAIIGGDDSEEQSEEEEKKGSKTGKYTVASEFRDISDFNKVHKVGSDVSHFDEARLKSLVESGLVNKE